MLPQKNDCLHNYRDRCKAVPQSRNSRSVSRLIQLFSTLFHRRFDLRYGGFRMFKHLIDRLVLLFHYVAQVVVQHLSGVFSYALPVLLLQVQQFQLFFVHLQ